MPLKGDFPINKIWKITPKLNISHYAPYVVYKSLLLIIHGATKPKYIDLILIPGVPHLVNKYYGRLIFVLSLKSAITRVL